MAKDDANTNGNRARKADITNVIDEITDNIRNIQRCIFLLTENGERSEEQRQVLGKATESLAIWETEHLHEIRKIFK